RREAVGGAVKVLVLPAIVARHAADIGGTDHDMWTVSRITYGKDTTVSPPNGRMPSASHSAAKRVPRPRPTMPSNISRPAHFSRMAVFLTIDLRAGKMSIWI